MVWCASPIVKPSAEVLRCRVPCRELAILCMSYDPEDRPAMAKVVEKLHAMAIQ